MTAPDTLPPELAALGELLREDPPRPDPSWAAGLDARAAAGFPRPPRRPPWRRLRPRLLVPALGAVAAAAIALVVVLAQSPRGELLSAPSAGSTVAPSDDTGGASSAAPAGSEGTSAPSGRSGGASSSARSFAPRPVPPLPGGGDPSTDGVRSRRQERSAALTLAAHPRAVEAVGDGIVRVTDAVGGYVASSSVSGGAQASGVFELRVPTSRLRRALGELSRLAHVRRRSQSSVDITAESVSARDRLAEARREREGLLRALGRATTLNQTQSIRARLRIVDGRIAAARAAVRAVGNRAAYANVSVQVVAERGAAAAPGDDGRWTPGDALRDAARVLEVAASVALVALAIAVPLAVLVALALAAARVAGHRRRERMLDLA